MAYTHPMVEQLMVDGKKFEGLLFPIGKAAPLIIIKGSKGFLACGYIDIATADQLNEAAAIVRGVNTFFDMTHASVQKVSPEAERIGVKVGMTGREALAILA